MDISRYLCFLLVLTSVTVYQIATKCVGDGCRCCASNACSIRNCTTGCKNEYPVCMTVSVVDTTCGGNDCQCCENNTCNYSSGVCLHGCKSGFHGRRCKNKCPDTCITCIDHPNSINSDGIGYCTACREGHFFTSNFYQCQSTCSPNCKSCTERSNCTSCMAGYFPDIQNPGGCISCANECNTCNELSGCVTCKTGFFRTTSNGISRCVPCLFGCLTCNSLTNCITCMHGRYGQSCDSLCSIGCKISCDKITGICQCKDNFAGDSCENCSAGMYGRNCTETCSKYCRNRICEKSTGYCNSCLGNYDLPECVSCISGYFGTDCNKSCPNNCINNACDQISGNCIEGCVGNFAASKCDECKPGKHGDLCQTNCSVTCYNFRCNKESGECSSCKLNFQGGYCDQCIDGKYNTDCSFNCSRNCSNSKCERSSGDCFLCNFNQTYGKICDKSCPSNCQNKTCVKENGRCDSGCKSDYSGDMCDDCVPGKYGPYCQKNCSLNCNNRICDQTNGDCTACVNINFMAPKCKNCTLGLYGAHCNLNCSKNCKGSACEKNSGMCFLGCVGDFSGDTCGECISGKYGSECTSDCPKNCLNNNCNFTSGFCSDCISNFTGNLCEECIDGLYGHACSQTCPPNCKDSICDKENGNCTNDCLVGYSGDKCCLNNTFCKKCLSNDECNSCKDGKHGQTCEQECPFTCKDRSCNKLNGTCNNCLDGFQGQFCMDSIFHQRKEEGNETAAPIVGTFSSIAVLSLVIWIVILYRRRRYTGKTENSSRFGSKERIYENADDYVSVQSPNRPSAANTSTMQETKHVISMINAPIQTSSFALKSLKPSTSESQTESNYYNTLVKTSKKIQVSKLKDYANGQSSEIFMKEFQTLPQGLLKPCTAARKPENLAKNRYNSIYPYDDDRVKLSPPGSDFINACYIDGYNKRREYIASLGPIVKATEDFKTFWRMVWQEKAEKIVMVTNLLEKGGMKCEKYWPDVTAAKSYGDVIVTGHEEEIFTDYTLRKFDVFKGGEKRPLYHIHYTAWPDKAVPNDVTSLIDFRQKVNTIKTKSNGPTIVHCSAGVGRTGTYIALDILTQEGETDGTVDVFGRVYRMRHQRTNMVQTWEQYEYLHYALAHILTFDCRPIAEEEFEEFVSSCSGAVMTAHFERLHSGAENVSESEVKARKRNTQLKPLNRQNADIPGNIGRPILYEGKTEGENNYINAVYLNSYRQKDRYILAMTPLPDTVTDFLTLLIQEKVTCVVSLDDEHSQVKDAGSYIPADNQILRLGIFKVKSCQVSSNSCYVQRTLTVIMRTEAGPKSQTVHHFQINHWTDGERVPHGNDRFLQLIREAEKAADDKGGKGTIVVHCLNAAERSGLFCAMSILLQKMEVDHEVSVINTLRQVKVRRSLAIPNREQYVFCHKCICTKLQSGDAALYTNMAMRQ